MARLTSILAYLVAAVSILVMVATVAVPILGLGGAFVSAAGLQTSANWSGGEVARVVEHGAYRTEIHRPVFDALIAERQEEFVQVAWRPLESLPGRIDEEIDADADGRADFRIELETATRQASLTPYSPSVTSLEGVYRLREALAIRVALKNPRH